MIWVGSMFIIINIIICTLCFIAYTAQARKSISNRVQSVGRILFTIIINTLANFLSSNCAPLENDKRAKHNILSIRMSGHGTARSIVITFFIL